jgi:hypothetical protein
MHSHPNLTLTAIRWSLLTPRHLPADASPPRRLLYGLLTGTVQPAASYDPFSVTIPGCSLPAGPFILFRLKRLGYSACRVSHSIEGLTVSGRR